MVSIFVFLSVKKPLDGKLNRLHSRMDEQFGELRKDVGKLQKDVTAIREHAADLTVRVTAVEKHVNLGPRA